MSKFSRQLVVLVGGKGTRLGALASDTPKPLMQITPEKVFLDYVLEGFVRQGFENVLLLAGHLGEQVALRYDKKRLNGARLAVLIEPEPRGTGGALQFALPHLEPTFIVANGDTLFDMNARALDLMLQSDDSLEGVIGLKQQDDMTRYGSVMLGPDGLIQAFLEKDATKAGVAGLINGGVYALRRRAIERLAGGNSSIEQDMFPNLAAQHRLAGRTSNGYFLDIGLPETLQIARRDLPLRRRPVLFLDRDGVINVDKNHLFKPEDFEWIDGAIDMIQRRNDLGHAVIVVTNQAGVAKGLYTEPDVIRLHQYIQTQLHERGAFIDAFYYCPYHAEASSAKYRIADHPDRKPRPGMLIKAFADAPLDKTNALLIGDQGTDIEAAQAIGVPAALFRGGNIADFEDNITHLKMTRNIQ